MIIPEDRLSEEDHVLDASARGVGVDHFETDAPAQGRPRSSTSR